MSSVRLPEAQKAVLRGNRLRGRICECLSVSSSLRNGGWLLWRRVRPQLDNRCMSTSWRNDGFSGYILILFIAISLFVLLQEKNPDVKSMSTDEAVRLLDSDTTAVFLDVRTPEEWKSSTGHLKNAVLIPLQDLLRQLEKLQPFRQRIIIVYCRSGNRSAKAARLLSERGFDAVNLRGGIREWNAKKYPVYQEKAP